MNVRQMWAAKLAGKPVPAALDVPANGAASGQASSGVRERTPFSGMVLGIDPSLRELSEIVSYVRDPSVFRVVGARPLDARL